jgi:protein TonB
MADDADAPNMGLTSAAPRHLLLGLVLLIHLFAGWTLWQFVGVKPAAHKPEPIVISLIAPAPAAPAAQMPATPLPPVARSIPSPINPPSPSLISLPASNLSVQPLNIVTAQTEAAAAPAAATPAAQNAAPAPLPLPSSAPRQIAASALRYLLEPQMTVPLLSRRLGESGIAHLRIVVDARGHLKEASLKKSSGFARLDQQALLDIRTARFAPYLENGQAVEWETVALLSYEIDR